MPKTLKALPNTRKEKRPKKKALDTASEWLDEAISLEDSGDRWVQTPAKAERFYLQAMEAYNKALNLDGSLFDAAYNKARLLLQISQSCALLAVPKLETVKSAVSANRQLLSRYSSNSDIRYNLATALMSYAELITEHEQLRPGQDDGAAESALKEAMELLEQCRASQTTELLDLMTETVFEEDSTSPAQAYPTNTVMDQDEEMDVDVTYISYNILFDTLIGTLECYVQLLLHDNLSDVAIAQLSKNLLQSSVLPQIQEVLPKCQSGDALTRYAEASHSITLAELEFAYRQRSLGLEEWVRQLEQIIGSTDASSVALLCSNADACITLASILSSSSTDQSETWKVLSQGGSSQITQAIEQMRTLSKKCPSLFITKADIELLRAAVHTEPARRNRGTLLKNATVFYKRAISDCLPKDIRLNNEAALKLAIVEGEISATAPQVPEMTRDEASQIIADARADGLFTGSWKLLDPK